MVGITLSIKIIYTVMLKVMVSVSNNKKMM